MGNVGQLLETKLGIYFGSTAFIERKNDCLFVRVPQSMAGDGVRELVTHGETFRRRRLRSSLGDQARLAHYLSTAAPDPGLEVVSTHLS